MSIDTRRSLIVTVKSEDSAALIAGNFNLVVAKGVVSGSGEYYNTVWHSTPIAPHTEIDWQPIYALNWTAELPTNDVAVNTSGNWKECAPGEVLDLNFQGEWESSTAAPTPGFLKVGSNKYKSGTDTDGIHIMVGIASGRDKDTGEYHFKPIYVDKAELGFGMSAIYQPQEKLQWWYQACAKGSTIVYENRGPIETGDFSSEEPHNGKSYHKESSYDFKTGEWTTKATKERD